MVSIRLACVLLSLLAAGRAAGTDSTSAPPPKLVVDAAWIRQPAPGADVGAAYFTVRNAGHTPTAVVGISCPAAGMAMLHETSISGGSSRMRPLERLEIAPGQTVVLEPGGLHVMLHGLKRTLEVGERIPLVLQLSDGETLTVTASVRPIGAQ